MFYRERAAQAMHAELDRLGLMDLQVRHWFVTTLITAHCIEDEKNILQIGNSIRWSDISEAARKAFENDETVYEPDIHKMLALPLDHMYSILRSRVGNGLDITTVQVETILKYVETAEREAKKERQKARAREQSYPVWSVLGPHMVEIVELDGVEALREAGEHLLNCMRNSAEYYRWHARTNGKMYFAIRSTISSKSIFSLCEVQKTLNVSGNVRYEIVQHMAFSNVKPDDWMEEIMTYFVRNHGTHL